MVGMPEWMRPILFGFAVIAAVMFAWVVATILVVTFSKLVLRREPVQGNVLTDTATAGIMVGILWMLFKVMTALTGC